MPLAVPLTENLALAVGALVLAAAGSGALVWRRPSLAGTTLVAPWWWALFSLWAIAGAQVARPWLASSGELWPAAVSFAAAATSFCPLMAALGAKRPQDKAWQLIVLSLWCILVLPAGEALLFGRGATFEVQGARSWFLAGLIGVGAANSLPTRYWLSSLLVAAGQNSMLLPYLPFGWTGMKDYGAIAGLCCFAVAIWVAVLLSLKTRSAQAPLDRVWLDFRDAFGALWGLRVAERMNAAAALYKWEIGLSWSGFHAADGSPIPAKLPAELAGAIRQNLDNLLRRFVSSEWIDERLDQATTAVPK